MEQRRLELGVLVQERAGIAARLEQVRARLDAREREILIAEERASHAELRIGQLARERGEVEARRAAIRPFCITIDRESESELKDLYGDVGYTIIDDILSLPERMPNIYRRLTS